MICTARQVLCTWSDEVGQVAGMGGGGSNCCVFVGNLE